jgi:hypothetical protein
LPRKPRRDICKRMSILQVVVKRTGYRDIQRTGTGWAVFDHRWPGGSLAAEPRERAVMAE